MDIFESLENLQVSEACFEDIIELVESKVDNYLRKNFDEQNAAYNNEKDPEKAEELYKKLNKTAGIMLNRRHNKSNYPAKYSLGTGNGSRYPLGREYEFKK